MLWGRLYFNMLMDTISPQPGQVEHASEEETDLQPQHELNERVRAEAEQYLTKPEFEAVFDAAVEAGALHADVVEEYKGLEGDARIARFREIFSDLNPRNPNKGGFVERSQLKDAISSPGLAEAVTAAADSVHMREPKPIPVGTKAKLGIVHGGAAKTPLMREELMLDGLEKGDASVEYLAMLGIDRPVDEAERGRAGEYAGESTTEAELMDAAAVHWMRSRGLDDIVDTRDEHESTKQGGYTSGMKYKVIMYDMSVAKADGRLTENFPDALFVVNAPIDATRLVREGAEGSLYKTRADTQDTLDFVAKTAGVEAGDTVLSISHQPVLEAQHLATQEAFLGHGAEVVSAGYHSAALSGNQNVLFSEVCKVVENAGSLRDKAASAEVEDEEPIAA